MRISLAATIAALLILFAHSVFAGGVDQEQRSGAGVYVNADFGYAWLSDQNVITATGAGLPATSVTAEGSGFGWLANIGYQLNQFFGIELGYIGLPDSDAIGKSIFSEFYGLDLAGKLILPISDMFSIYGKAGVARMAANQESLSNPQQVGATTTSFFSRDLVEYTGFFALGIGYEVVQDLTINLQGTTTLETDPLPASYLVTIGLGYQFAV